MTGRRADTVTGAAAHRVTGRAAKVTETAAVPTRTGTVGAPRAVFHGVCGGTSRFVGRFATGAAARKNRGACRHGGAVVRRCTSVAYTWRWRGSYGEVAGKWWIS
ncbi:hypothetical protein GCM10010512_42330 [Streptomyces thermoviolaceus subsp. thermoviolaceus]|nr:hypothetical protein GCM10010499_17630 [Streptomyces thermoviolaceus subsp. apingens]GHB06382.1 hypothetical protein GCM10010512_42330 [Streptomyces thermoviolaceus subsp. thermoviolaceus]